MSLGVALQNAISGVQTSQQYLQVTSNNIANVNTEGYTRKIIDARSRRIEGVGYGVEIAQIVRRVDEGLLRQLRVETGSFEELTLKNSVLGQINSLFGRPEDDNSITHLIADFGSAFDALAVTPETSATQFLAVKAGQDVAQELKRLSDEIQRLRSDANLQINNAITEINSALDTIVDTNSSIIEFTASGISTAELEDQRDIALNTVSKYMDIKYFGRADGSLTVFTGDGKTLVDGQKQALSYNQPATMDPSLEYVPLGSANYTGPGTAGYPAGGIPGIFVGEATPESDITNGLSTGKLKALIDMRDTTLTSLQDQIDELAEQMQSAINSAHNGGAGYPPAPSLTGTQYVESGTEFGLAGATGIARFAVVDNTGNLIEDSVLDMSAYNTVGDFVTALNGMTNLSASITSDGRLQVTGLNNYRVAINELTSDVSGTGKTNVGVSDFFGLNDFLVSPEDFSHYRSDRLSTRTGAVVTSGGDLHFSGNDGAAWSTTVNYAANASLDDLVTAINADATLQAENISAQVVSDGTGFRLELVDDDSDEFAIVESSGGSALTDVDLRTDTRGLAKRVSVRSDIQENTFLVSRGALQSNTFTSDALTSDTTDFTTLGLTVPGTLTFTIDASTSVNIPYTGADTLQSMVTAINNNATLVAANVTAEVIVDGSNYRLKVVDQDGDNFDIADSVGAGGLNVDTSQGITIGDGSVARDMAGVFEATLTFDAAPEGGNGLARADTTLGVYSATILSFNSALANTTDRDLGFQTSLKDELFNKHSSISGVNLDEELAGMIVYEQAYMAAARMITTTQELFKILEDIV